MLSQIVLADLGDARRVFDSRCPTREFPGMDTLGMSISEFEALYSILTLTESIRPLIQREDFLFTGSVEGPWVVRLLDDFVTKLAGLTESELPRIGSEWALSDEVTAHGTLWSPNEVLTILYELAAWCRQATKESKLLLMWMTF